MMIVEMVPTTCNGLSPLPRVLDYHVLLAKTIRSKVRTLYITLYWH